VAPERLLPAVAQVPEAVCVPQERAQVPEQVTLSASVFSVVLPEFRLAFSMLT